MLAKGTTVARIDYIVQVKKFALFGVQELNFLMWKQTVYL